MAAASLLRSIAGCVLPLFADSLFLHLGYGWGGTVLALVSLVSLLRFWSKRARADAVVKPAIPAPVVLFFYGKQLRERYKFEP